jgi:prepilin-type N-terminal cleavage/methylation domain-containing protein
MTTTQQTGFTLYELMITLLIVGIVLSVGIPNFAEFSRNGKITTTANDLHSTFYLARTEATRAKNIITICSSLDPMNATPACGGQFEDGWIVFEDLDGDIAVDAGESILKAFPPTRNGVAIDSQGATDYFSFAATGLGRGDIGGVTAVTKMMICDDRGNSTAAGGYSAARVLVVTPLGRATVLREEAQVAFHGGCP